MADVGNEPSAIRATRVIGTPVQNVSGEAIGRIEDIVLDKCENRIMFAVVGFGGVLGLGEKFHPLPWSALDYSPDHEAYIVPYDLAQLKEAPSDSIEELLREEGTDYRERTYDHFKAERYWV